MSIVASHQNYKKEYESEIQVDKYHYIVASLFLESGANTVSDHVGKITTDNAIRTLARKK